MSYYKRLPKAIIWDLDGTIACGKHRLHLLPPKEIAHLNESWDDFNLASSGDSPIENNVAIMKALKDQGFYTLILTGRSDIAKKITEEWLYDNNIPYDYLVMRRADDNRKDTEVKEMCIRSLMRFYNIVCCFDDLEHVVHHIRSLGITCHQVTHYDEKTVAEESHGED